MAVKKNSQITVEIMAHLVMQIEDLTKTSNTSNTFRLNFIRFKEKIGEKKRPKLEQAY